ncbi:hypothetical protein BGZ49_009811 [Haplosporangium sp. Z 27]|nr:hypothetical protein BGZ49_009811 [Haplosporangium sp. Z 27]
MFQIVSILRYLLSIVTLANTTSAYYYQAEVGFVDNANATVNACVTVVDPQIWSNTAALRNCSIILLNYIGNSPLATFDFEAYGYSAALVVLDRTSEELTGLQTIDQYSRYLDLFPCAKFDEYPRSEYGTPYVFKIYNCDNSKYFGVKGIPVSSFTDPLVTRHLSTIATATFTTTSTHSHNGRCPEKPTTTTKILTHSHTKKCQERSTTTITSVITSTVALTTKSKTKVHHIPTTSHNHKHVCSSSHKGKKHGSGSTGARCKASRDCIDTCVKGKCGLHP